MAPHFEPFLPRPVGSRRSRLRSDVPGINATILGLGAQVLLGVWLGCMFDREMLTRARSFIPAAFLTTIFLLVLCAAMALAVGALTGTGWQTMVLATAPGSVTEMALTAKILEEGVAVVTAYHVVRIFVIIPSAPLIFAITARLAKPQSG